MIISSLKIHIGWNKKQVHKAMQGPLFSGIPTSVLVYIAPLSKNMWLTMCDRKEFPPRSGNKMAESEIKTPTNLQSSIFEIIYVVWLTSQIVSKGHCQTQGFFFPTSCHQVGYTLCSPLCVWKSDLKQMAGFSARAKVKLVVSPQEILPDFIKTKLLATNTYKI